MSLDEMYEWAQQQRATFEQFATTQEGGSALARELAAGGDHPIEPVRFRTVTTSMFRGEVAMIGPDLVFHFWPNEGASFPPPFADQLAESFLAVFKFNDRLFWDYVPELTSWVVRAAGWSESPAREELSNRLFAHLLERTTA